MGRQPQAAELFDILAAISTSETFGSENSPPSFEDDPVSGSAAPKTISPGAFAAGAAVGAVVAAVVAAGPGAAAVGGALVGTGVAAGAHATIIAAPINNAAISENCLLMSLLLKNELSEIIAQMNCAVKSTLN